jgi:hypothetical protein
VQASFQTFLNNEWGFPSHQEELCKNTDREYTGKEQKMRLLGMDERRF